MIQPHYTPGTHPNSHPIHWDRIAMTAALYLAGYTMTEIRALGCRSVYRDLRTAGISSRPRGARPNWDTVALVAAMYEADYPITQIEALTGPGAYQRLRLAGIRPNRQAEHHPRPQITS